MNQNFKNLQPEISQPILSKNGFVKQIWHLPGCTATRSDFWPLFDHMTPPPT